MVALSIKIVVTCIVQLIGTRIALSALGGDAFGLYNLLAGIIILFTFLTGSLLISTQRYLSIAMGEHRNDKLCSIFNVSLFIHFISAIFIVALLYSIKSFLFSYVLNIEEGYKHIAGIMYDIITISTSITILSIPYSALMNAHEDMFAFALIEISSLILKLFAALALLITPWDLLLTYTIIMSFSIIWATIIKYIWCNCKYSEAKIQFKLMRNKTLFNEMVSFVAWNTLGSAAVVIRNQGVAVLLNMFYGTIINAAYGIANQVNSLVLSFATTLTTVFTPSIVQSKGEGNNNRMLRLAVLSSKLSFFISSLLALPILVFLDEILTLWLKDVPIYTNSFVFWIVLSFLIQQLYPGINRAIYAEGKIKAYQVSLSIILISILPVGFLLLKLKVDVVWVIITMFVLQIFTLISTIYYAKQHCNLEVLDFLKNSVLKPVVLFSVTFISFKYLEFGFAYDVNILASLTAIFIMCIIYSVLYYMFVLNDYEKHQLYSALYNLLNHLFRNN